MLVTLLVEGDGRLVAVLVEVLDAETARRPNSGPAIDSISLKNSTINEQKNTISKSLNLLDAGHLPSGNYRGG